MSNFDEFDGLTVSDLGEKRLLREVIGPLLGESRAPVSFGDDAAVVECPVGHRLVCSTDKIPEDLLALKMGLMSPFEHGRYLAIVNISDIAATGGVPAYLLCNLCLPGDFRVTYLAEFMRGFVSGAAEYDAEVIGGDTGWGSAPCFSATAFGFVETGREVRRSGARPGDVISVSGIVGGFATALAYFLVARDRGLQLPREKEAWLRQKLVRPLARVSSGRKLALSGSCTSMMDITDGLGQSLSELSAASDASLVVDTEALPIDACTVDVANFLGVDPTAIIFGIGLELELLFTTSSAINPEYEGWHPIGRVVDGPRRVRVETNGQRVNLQFDGWQHFGRSAEDVVRRIAGLHRS